MYLIIQYFLIFLFYCFLGWLGESLYVSTVDSVRKKKIHFINRGFLSGPVTPIYGVSAMIMIIAIVPFSDSYWKTIVIGMVLCDAVEYLTSYVMEKLFHARWWDYTGKPGNINGRIDLKHTLIWGAASVLFAKVIWPFTEWLFVTVEDNLGWNKLFVLFLLLLIVFVLDIYRTVEASIDIAKVRNMREKVKATIQDFDPQAALKESDQAKALAGNVREVRQNIHISSSWQRRHLRQIYKVYPSLMEAKAEDFRAAEVLESSPSELLNEVRFARMDLESVINSDGYEFY